ncbi:MAG: hypothetical protein ABSF37_12575 [Sedimentisphaerales bacterium]|jgi:hypothetical protein
MIKTLRITSIIAAIAATGLLVLPAVYGVRSNPKIEELLKSPGIVEKFTSAKGQQASKDQSQNSPLVKEALALTKIINPPPPPKPEPATQPSGPSQPAPSVPVTAKFDLVATSYFASHPEQSFVLIDEPGKGQHWVKQGSTVGHLTIETVKDGSIVLRDGQRTSEMTVKVQESWRKLLKNPPPSARSSSPEEPVAAGQKPAGSKGPENAISPSPVTANKPAGIIPPNSRRNPRQGAMPPASERITSPNQPPNPPVPVSPTPAAAPISSEPPTAQPQPAETTPAPEIAPPPQPQIPEKPESPAIREKSAQIDKLMAEMGSSTDEKKTDELLKEIEELGKMREAEDAKDANK